MSIKYFLGSQPTASSVTVAWGPPVVPLLLPENVSHGANSTYFHFVESSFEIGIQAHSWFDCVSLIASASNSTETSRVSWSLKETTEE